MEERPRRGTARPADDRAHPTEVRRIVRGATLGVGFGLLLLLLSRRARGSDPGR